MTGPVSKKKGCLQRINVVHTSPFILHVELDADVNSKTSLANGMPGKERLASVSIDLTLSAPGEALICRYPMHVDTSSARTESEFTSLEQTE
jgi:hypothetical protein